MKKGWKILGAIAGLAALLPYSVKKDEENDKLTVRALLWKYTNQPDPETPDNRSISVDIGFQNPLAAEDDDLFVDEDPAQLELLDAEEDISASDIEMTLSPVLNDEPEAPVQPEL